MPRTIANGITFRVWQNYLMPSRLTELENWLQYALGEGYCFHPVSDYWRLTQGGRVPPAGKAIVLRHDIDVDLSAARAVFSLEKRLGIRGSFYFRLCTIDVALMRAIAEWGGEASYHYEELATEAKTACARSRPEAQAQLPAARARFLSNLRKVRELTGLPITTAASHGDWLNRALRLPNTVILKDPEMRQECGIEVEAYDADLLEFVAARYSDAPCPVWWHGTLEAAGRQGSGTHISAAPPTPLDALKEGVPVVYVLLHPEQWRSGIAWHFKADLQRVREALAYRLRVPIHVTL